MTVTMGNKNWTYQFIYSIPDEERITFLTFPEGDERILNVILFIAVIGMASVTGVLFRTQNSNAGKHVFAIGSIVITAATGTFIFMTGIILIHYVAKMLQSSWEA